MKVLVIHKNYNNKYKSAIVDIIDDDYEILSKCNNIHFDMFDHDSPNYYKKLSSEALNSIMVINFAFEDDNSRITNCTTDLERKYFGKWKSIDNISDISGVDRIINTWLT